MTQYRSRLADQPLSFAVTATERLHDGFRPLDRFTVRHEALDGGMLEVRREIVRGGACAVAIPYDPERDAIVVIRQFRIGAALATPHAAPLELPAGGIDEGEAPEEGAARELREETGLEAKAIAHCYTILSTPGLTDETIAVFLAIVDAGALETSGGLADEYEDILPVLAPVDDLILAVDEGRIQNGFLVGAAHWFARHGRAKARGLADSIREDTA